MNPVEFLRALAQNDYMIDGKFLPDGEILIKVSIILESIKAATEQEV